MDNPYIGILDFLVIPAILFLGLALIPIGIFLSPAAALFRIARTHGAGWGFFSLS